MYIRLFIIIYKYNAEATKHVQSCVHNCLLVYMFQSNTGPQRHLFFGTELEYLRNSAYSLSFVCPSQPFLAALSVFSLHQRNKTWLRERENTTELGTLTVLLLEKVSILSKPELALNLNFFLRQNHLQKSDKYVHVCHRVNYTHTNIAS